MRHISIHVLLASALSVGVTCAADNIKWLGTEYDFGTIREESGKAHGQVRFVNLGPEATMIQRVKSTCGCTGVGFTEGVIAPGDTATVWFDYDPTGRPGRFEKHVKAYTGVNNDLTSITLKGTVIGAPHSLDSKYPVVNGGLRLSADVIPLGKTTWGTSRHKYIYGYNQSADTLSLSWKDVPRFVSLGVSSRSVAPGDLFTVSAYLNTRDGAEIGSLDAPFTFIAEGADGAVSLPVHITADIVPDISAYTDEQLRESPSATLYPTLLELGEVRGDKHIKQEFFLRNEGKTPLALKRVHCPQFPSLIKTKSMPRSLKPGESKPIKLNINPDVLPKGIFKIAVEVVTDDPLHPTRNVHLIGTRPE